MQVVFKVKTPKGQATGTNKKIKNFIIGFNKVKVNTYVNEDDSEIIWEIEGGIKQIFNIQKNLSRFDAMINTIFTNKLMQKYMGSNIKKEEIKELEEMLRNQTSLEIIKKATLEEEDEYNRSFMQRIKAGWQKINPFD